MAYETLIVETRGAVGLITLNRPQALNALNSTVLKELLQAHAAFEADDGDRRDRADRLRARLCRRRRHQGDAAARLRRGLQVAISSAAGTTSPRFASP
jgi:hypothetical protein